MWLSFYFRTGDIIWCTSTGVGWIHNAILATPGPGYYAIWPGYCRVFVEKVL